jgi:hypothetical protein
MYKSGSHHEELRTRVYLTGYPMDIKMSGHACQRARQRIKADANDVLQRISLLLENPEVAEYITLDVKIGEDCVVFDADTGNSYVLVVQETEIVVKTVYAPDRASDTFIASRGSDFCMLVKKAEVLFTGISDDFRRSVENVSMGLGIPAVR